MTALVVLFIVIIVIGVLVRLAGFAARSDDPSGVYVPPDEEQDHGGSHHDGGHHGGGHFGGGGHGGGGHSGGGHF